MKHTWKAAAAGALAVLFVSPNAQAQLAVAKVVATCGTVSPTPHAGANYPLTIDITGTLCSVGGGGGGGGGTSSNFGAAFPGAGTAAGFEYLTVPPTLTTGQMVAGQTDINGNLKVTVVAGGGSNASVGTTAAAVPGSATYAGMNVSGNLTGLAGTANGLKVDGSAVTQPVSASALPLPTGAATSALQTTGNTALTAINTTLGAPMQTTGGTVGLVAGAAAIGTVNPTTATLWGILTQGATTSGQLGNLMMGAVTTAAPTYTTGQTSPFSLDTTGAVRVNVTAGGGTGGTSSSFGATFPSTGTAAGLEYLTTAPTLTNGQMVAGQTDINGNLKVNVIAGGGTLTWPGSAGNGTLGATGSGTAPYVNAYLPAITGQTLTTVQPAVSAFGAPGPASGAAMGANGPGPFDPIIQAHATLPINISTAVTTQLVALVSSQKIYVTSWDVMAPSGNFTLEYGTGTLCGTGTTALTGPEAMAGGQVGKGVGLGPVLIIPASNALCVVTSAAVQYSGSLSYVQF